MITAITGLIGGLLYPLFSIIFGVIDLLQGVFYGLAGIGDIGFDKARTSSGSFVSTIGSSNDGGETSTGLIYYLLTSDLIKNLFLSIMLLAVFLIIIFTAMAFIKNAYASKQKTWQEIVGNAFKGLANFIFIPVCCLLGVWLSNILLLAINGATSTGGATAMSRKLYICCAYDANTYRNQTEVSSDDIADIKVLVNKCKDVEVDFDENHDKKDVEYFANIVDTLFATSSNVNIGWYYDVEDHYSLFNFNYLTLVVGGVFMLYVLVSVAYAMIKRMFILLMLFVISPAICAMYPLDEGSAVGSWKKEFIKYTIAAYGAIAGMNLFFSILPIVENINLASGDAFTNEIFQLLIMVSGLFVVKEFMGTLSGWIGGDNAMATGESLRKQTKGAMDKYAKPAVNKTIGAFGNMAGHMKSEGFWKGMGSSFVDTFAGTKNKEGKREGGLLRFMGGESVKNVEETIKGVKDSYKYGKDAKGEAEKKQTEDIIKKETAGSKKAFDEKVKNRGLLNQTDDERYNFVKEGMKAGFTEDEAIRKLYDSLGGRVKFNDLKENFKDVKEKKDEEKAETARMKARNAQTAERQEDNEAIATAISEKLAEVLQTSRPAGETRAEETKREREESAYLKAMTDYLAKLVSLEQTGAGEQANQALEAATKGLMSALTTVGPNGVTPGFKTQAEKIVQQGGELSVGQISGRAEVTQANFDKIQPQVDAYNAALANKQAAEEMAKEATRTFVEEMKKAAAGHADALKVIEKFEQATNHTVDAVQKLAKEIQDLLKK